MCSTSCRKVSPSRVRHPRESDREPLYGSLSAAVYRSLEASVSYLCTDLEYVVDRIIKGEELLAVILDDSYLLVYSIGSPWYSKSTVLVEDMVLRLAPGSHFSVVTDYLEDLAEQNDCDMILVGGALARSSRAITRLYQRQGFTVEGVPQLSKRRR